MSDPLLMDATAQLQLMGARRLGALELLDLSVARARVLADTVNAVVAADVEPARAAAKLVDDRRTLIARAGGDPESELGLLAGLPMTVKDVLDVDGLPASSGLARHLERGCSDADAVGRVKAAGAVVWGKTNTPELAGDWQTSNALYGVTANPWDLSRTPGGSSGGAGAALAGGITALEIGSDLSGSLRIPAGFCGVFAHKPTYGLVSQRGHVPPAPGALAEPDLNVVGPMARSTRDLRLLLSVLAPAALPARSLPADLVGLRVGWWLDAPGFALAADARTVLEAWAAALARAGAHVEPVSAPVDPGLLLDTFDTLMTGETARGCDEGRYARRRALRAPAHLGRALGAGPGSWAARTLAVTASHRDWLEADEARARLQRRMQAAFEAWDVLVCPAAPCAAFSHDRRAPWRRRVRLEGSRRSIAYAELARWSALATTLGLPATCLPAGRTAAGLPVGLQVIGPAGADSRTLAVAEAMETELGGFEPPPARG